MERAKDDLAFPFVSHGAFADHQLVAGGLTKREYFAGLAMQGLLINKFSCEQAAVLGVETADMLMLELEKEQS